MPSSGCLILSSRSHEEAEIFMSCQIETFNSYNHEGDIFEDHT